MTFLSCELQMLSNLIPLVDQHGRFRLC